MTTTEQLREYLDAHGVDGAPTELGWFVVECFSADEPRLPIVVVHCVPGDFRLTMCVGGLESMVLLRSDCTRHAPITLALPAGRDLDAEAIAGVHAASDEGKV